MSDHIDHQHEAAVVDMWLRAYHGVDGTTDDPSGLNGAAVAPPPGEPNEDELMDAFMDAHFPGARKAGTEP